MMERDNSERDFIFSFAEKFQGYTRSQRKQNNKKKEQRDKRAEFFVFSLIGRVFPGVLCFLFSGPERQRGGWW